jgi:hypothetical protein
MRSGSGAQRLWVKPTIPHKCLHLFPFLEISLRSLRLRAPRHQLARMKGNPTFFMMHNQKPKPVSPPAHDHQGHANTHQKDARPSPARDPFAKKEFPTQCAASVAQRRNRNHQTDVFHR